MKTDILGSSPIHTEFLGINVTIRHSNPAHDIQVVMERIPEFLYLKLGVWSKQILTPKMRLSERQVEEDACTPPEYPGVVWW